MVVFGKHWIFIGNDYRIPEVINDDKKDSIHPNTHGLKFERLLENFKKEDEKFNFDDWDLLESEYAYTNYKKSINHKLNLTEIKDGSLFKIKCLCTTCIEYLFPVYNTKNKEIPFAFIGNRCIWHFENDIIKNQIIDAIKDERNMNKIFCVKCISNPSSKALSDKTLETQYYAPYHRKCMDSSLSSYLFNFKCKNYHDIEIIRNRIIKEINNENFNNPIDYLECKRKFDKQIDLMKDNIILADFYEMEINFGKHKGRTLNWVMDNDKSYINWIVSNDKFVLTNFKDKLLQLIKMQNEKSKKLT